MRPALLGQTGRQRRAIGGDDAADAALRAAQMLTASIAIAFPVLATDNSSQNDTDTVTVVGNWLDNPDTSSVLLNHPGARSIVTQQQMHDIDRNAAKGIAAASALNIVTPYLPGRTTLNAGVANYRGQQAVGLGVSRWNEKGTINYNLGVSSSGGNSTIVRAGIGIVLGN